jgi:hypothetical protein
VKGFILGVICTVVVGGSLFYLQAHYATLDTCQALNRSLQESVADSIRTDLQGKTDIDILGKMASALLQPVAEPLIAAQVQRETADNNWLDCGVELVRIDFFGKRDVYVDAIKQRLMSSATDPARE